MSGYLGREQRAAFVQPVGVVDVSRDLATAGAMSARQGEQIAGVLGQGAGQLFREADKEAKREGEVAGASEALVRDAQGNLAPPSLDQHMLLTEGERTRRATLGVRYGAEFVLENQQAYTDLRARIPDPVAFRQAATAHAEGVLEAVPEAVRGAVRQGLDREIQRNVTAMQAETLQREREEGLAAGNANLANTFRDLTSVLGRDAGGPGGTVAGVPPALMPVFQSAAAATGVPLPILLAVAKQESGFGANTGTAGGGIMQIIRSTAEKPGIPGLEPLSPADRDDPAKAITWAARYLAGASPNTDWNDPKQVDAALRRYNGGGDPNYVANVRRHIEAETRPASFVVGEPDGLVTRGNIDLNARPTVQNADGSISTVRSMSVEIGGKEVLIPTVSADGRMLTDDQAVAEYRRTGKHLGMFGTPDQATAYAEKLHEAQERQYARGQVSPDVQALQSQARAQLDQMVAARLITPTAAAERMRYITEVMPVQTRLQREAARAGDVGGQAIAQALLDGPGSPGWRPEWNVLRDDERQPLARVIAASASHRRTEQQHQLTLQSQAASSELAQIQVDLVPLNRAALEPAGLNPQQAAQRQQLLDRARELTPAARNSVPASILEGAGRVDAAGAAVRTQATLNQDAITRAQGVVRQLDQPADEVPHSARVAAQVASLPLAAQAEIWGREAHEAQARLRASEREAGPLQTVLTALQGGPRAENNAANQAVVLGLLQGQHPLSPAAAPMVIGAAAGGVVPQQLVTAGAALLQPGSSPESLAAFAALHQKMMADPRAANRWQAAIGDDLNRAYTGMADRLAGLDPKDPKNTQAFEAIRTAAAAAARNQHNLDDARRGLGATRDEQTRTLNEAVAAAASAAGGPANLPGPMGRELERATLENFAAGHSVQLAARMAVESMKSRGWGVSELGAGSLASGGLMPQLSRGLTEAANAEGGMEMLQAQRWMQHPPEQYAAPFGRGGETGTRWLRERMGDVVKAAQIDGGHERLQPGVNLLLRPSDPGAPLGSDGKPTFELWYQKPDGAWMWVREGDTAAPHRLDLAAEQKAHQARWNREDRPEWERAARTDRETGERRAAQSPTSALRYLPNAINPLRLLP